MDFEDDDIKNLLEISECKANFFYNQKLVSVSILYKDYITDTLSGKLYLREDCKNFEDIKINFNCLNIYMEKIEDINIYNYNSTYDRLIYYSLIKPNIENIKKNGKKRSLL